MAPKFLRTDYMRFSRIGKNRKNKQVWRRATGVHSKIRRKRRNYPSMPTVGYKTARKDSGKINGLTPRLVHNVNDISKLDKKSIIILAKVGARKKIDLIKKADEMGITILNIGSKK